MNEPIHEKVSVLTSFDPTKGEVIPKKIKWQGHIYITRSVGFHYTTHAGSKLLHYFSVLTEADVSFKLCLDTQTLHWILEEIIDDTTN